MTNISIPRDAQSFKGSSHDQHEPPIEHPVNSLQLKLVGSLIVRRSSHCHEISKGQKENCGANPQDKVAHIIGGHQVAIRIVSLKYPKQNFIESMVCNRDLDEYRPNADESYAAEANK